MKLYNWLFIFLCLLYTVSLSAQESSTYELQLSNRKMLPEKNIAPALLQQYNLTAAKFEGKSYCIIQLERLAGADDQKTLKDAGIVLLEYIPSNAYLAEINKPLEETALRSVKTRSIISITTDLKIDPSVIGKPQQDVPVKLWVALYNSVTINGAIAALQQLGYPITSFEHKEYRILEVTTAGKEIPKLASLPFIKYIEKAPPAPQPLNNESRSLSRANLVQTGLPGGYNLTGEGIAIGVGEVFGPPYAHVDFAERLIQIGTTQNNYHSTHVNGIVGGAGLINELYKGYAPGATIVAGSGGMILPYYFEQQGMVLTNNSFTSGGPCYTRANPLAQIIYDGSANNYPAVQHVFAAGNSGTLACANNYPAGFNTIEGSQGSAKSTISAGNTLKDGTLNAGSSKGPTLGGRLKPDIVAAGTNIISTAPYNAYYSNTGTSMAAPAVTGGLALMYQRYKQLHNNQPPTAALMKAILCNTATDAGNAGPDFSYGFGQMNLYRAVKAIDGQQYFIDSLANQQARTNTITIPAGGAQLKILLYWQDPAASALSSRTLVNDLDLTVTAASGNSYLPYKLDTNAANVTNPATRGEDHINNVEQVVIDFPQAGNYTINVKGTAIAGLPGPLQAYCVTYDLVPNAVMLSFPSGNETLLPAEKIKLQWDTWGAGNAGYMLEFSPDSGMNWQLISNAVKAGAKQFDWQLPNITTTNARIRLTRNTDGASSISGKFSLIDQPVASLNADQCPGNISLQWNAIAMADAYEVMIIQNGKLMVSDTVQTTGYTWRNLSEDSTYWCTVRAMVNHQQGRRAVAISRKPDNGNCADSRYDNDLKADSLLTPTSGRAFTSNKLHADEEIIFRIKNLDNQPATACTASYSVNNGPFITENISVPIPANGFFTYHFATRYNFSAPGIYRIVLTVKNNSIDQNSGNDTAQFTVRQLANEPFAASAFYTENFDQAQSGTYGKDVFGLPGIERFDYTKTDASGNISFPSNLLTDSSGQSLQLTYTGYDFSFHEQALTATFNLGNRHAATDRVMLGFTYLPDTDCYGCLPDSSSLQVRGNDTLPWIEVMKLNPDQQFTILRNLEGVNLSKYLLAAGQDYSSSFQVKWVYAAASNTYLLDNIVLYDGSNNLGVSWADTLPLHSCNLGNIPVKIKISNTGTAPAMNVQVYYSINGGARVKEIIAVVPGDTTLLFNFTGTANPGAPGLYTLETGLIYPPDTYTADNIKTRALRNQPLINQFPYLQQFEENDGYWYTGGTHSSWAYGKPAAVLINRAASGNMAWKTNLSGNHNSNEYSFLYSPCVDYSSLQHPALSFSMALNTDSCSVAPGFYCESVRLYYSTDGIKWTGIPTDAANYHFYTVWSSRNYYRWHVVTGALPAVQGPVQFRFAFRSDSTHVHEGVAIDDIHIYDRSIPIYDSTLNGATISAVIAGGDQWTAFFNNNKIIAAVNAYGQNLGNTQLKAYVKNILPVSHFHGQYYLNRTFALRTEKQFSDSIGVRLYFLDSETDSLLFAGNCSTCDRPADAYQLGVSKYNTPSAAEENDSISDNIKGEWSFIENKKVKIVPYDRGYYAEFKVKDLSEFRLNSGGPGKKSWLPVELINFTATPSAGATNITWTTASEINLSRFEIEVAKSNDDYLNNIFSSVGSVNSQGPAAQNQRYQYADTGSGKKLVWYYRLKTTDTYGNYAYSRAVAVVFTDELQWKLYPNPSDGLYTLSYQAKAGDKLTVTIYNTAGQLLQQQVLSGDGFVQQATINLKNNHLANAVYMMRISKGNRQYHCKLVKQ